MAPAKLTREELNKFVGRLHCMVACQKRAYPESHPYLQAPGAMVYNRYANLYNIRKEVGNAVVEWIRAFLADTSKWDFSEVKSAEVLRAMVEIAEANQRGEDGCV